jgi:hypothetical protein
MLTQVGKFDKLINNLYNVYTISQIKITHIYSEIWSESLYRGTGNTLTMSEIIIAKLYHNK